MKTLISKYNKLHQQLSYYLAVECVLVTISNSAFAADRVIEESLDRRGRNNPNQ
jgi:hypothetical protein